MGRKSRLSVVGLYSIRARESASCNNFAELSTAVGMVSVVVFLFDAFSFVSAGVVFIESADTVVFRATALFVFLAVARESIVLIVFACTVGREDLAVVPIESGISFAVKDIVANKAAKSDNAYFFFIHLIMFYSLY